MRTFGLVLLIQKYDLDVSRIRTRIDGFEAHWPFDNADNYYYHGPHKIMSRRDELQKMAWILFSKIISASEHFSI